jgi:hypothetical protein
MEVSPPFGLDTLCPIGQIEKAIAEGLEKIDARINSRNIAAEEIYNRQRYPDAKPQ